MTSNVGTLVLVNSKIWTRTVDWDPEKPGPMKKMF